MTKRQDKLFGERLIENLETGVRDLKKGRRLRRTFVSVPPAPPRFNPREVARLRKELGMTQDTLAAFLNVSDKTVESWEQGLRRPGGAALRLLQVMKDPGVLTAAGVDTRRKGRAGTRAQGRIGRT